MLPFTTERVRQNTDVDVNQQIRRETESRVAGLRRASSAAIEGRLDELNEEWDVERALEANAASVCLIASMLGITVNRSFLYLPAVVGGFLLQHALQGWCPPLPILRRLGFRTASEIDNERLALRIIRGDFDHLIRKSIKDRTPAEVLETVRAS